MYALLLTPADGLHDERLVYASVNSETETVIILEANLTLAIKTLWDVIVLAYGCTENPVTNGHELSKEDTHTMSYIVHTYTHNIIMSYIHTHIQCHTYIHTYNVIHKIQ